MQPGKQNWRLERIAARSSDAMLSASTRKRRESNRLQSPPVHEPDHQSLTRLACGPGKLTESEFRPAWWLSSAHLQTLWAPLFRRPTRLQLRRERFELDDGDFLDLDWTTGESGPVVLVLHGLEGSSQSPYALGLLAALQRRGWRGAVMHFRGCSEEPNRLERSYHSGETGDLSTVVNRLRSREPDMKLGVIGCSLGGNVLLKWLGETGEKAPIDAAVAVCVPFLLGDVADRLDRGFSRVYRQHLLRALRRKLRRKYSTRAPPPELDFRVIERAKTMRSFDDAVTAPLHGFANAEEYYRCSSCRQFLGSIARPTLILHALDDPFMIEAVVPERDELSPTTRLELSARGGHVGFVNGPPWKPGYWLEDRVPAFVAAFL